MIQGDTYDKRRKLYIRKPASAGYENIPAVMLQAHLDMVCEKVSGVEHDFDKDPIYLELNGDILSTGGRTTLGADDGIGVAYAMTILEDKEVKPLISCCLQAVPKGYQAYGLKVSGLPGGHSGEDTNKGFGNANVLLGRLLSELQNICSYYIASLTGGSFRLAIPREAEAIVLLPPDKEGELMGLVEKMGHFFKKEYEMAAPDFSLSCEQTVFDAGEASSPEGVKKLVTAMLLSPNGISEMNNAVRGVVESSDNMGEITLEKERYVIIYEIRASLESTRSYIYEKIKLLAEIVEGTCKTFANYPSWEFQPVSQLRKVTSETYQKEFGKEMKTLVVHCGLECGCLYPKMPGLDAISIGPNCVGLHSPGEQLSVSSSDRVYRLIKGVLENMK